MNVLPSRWRGRVSAAVSPGIVPCVLSLSTATARMMTAICFSVTDACTSTFSCYSAIAQSITAAARWHGVTFNALLSAFPHGGGGYERLSGGFLRRSADLLIPARMRARTRALVPACAAGFTMVASANIIVTSISLPPYNTQLCPAIFIPIISTFTCQFNSPSAFMWYWECTAAFTNNPTILLDRCQCAVHVHGTRIGSPVISRFRPTAACPLRCDLFWLGLAARRLGSRLYRVDAAVKLLHLSQVKRNFGPRAGRSPAPGSPSRPASALLAHL